MTIHNEAIIDAAGLVTPSAVDYERHVFVCHLYHHEKARTNDTLEIDLIRLFCSPALRPAEKILIPGKTSSSLNLFSPVTCHLHTHSFPL